jgi:hypothetical protein
MKAYVPHRNKRREEDRGQYYTLVVTALFVSVYPNLLNDLAYLWFKSHVKHPVCLI